MFTISATNEQRQTQTSKASSHVALVTRVLIRWGVRMKSSTAPLGCDLRALCSDPSTLSPVLVDVAEDKAREDAFAAEDIVRQGRLLVIATGAQVIEQEGQDGRGHLLEDLSHRQGFGSGELLGLAGHRIPLANAVSGVLFQFSQRHDPRKHMRGLPNAATGGQGEVVEQLVELARAGVDVVAVDAAGGLDEEILLTVLGL